MSFVNTAGREINCKVIYYGPGLGGKTTNIQYIYQKTAGPSKSELTTVGTNNERTLFFDFLPLELGEIRGHKTRFHLYTVPGQIIYEAGRKLILRGVDGVIFVADSQVEKMEANLESFQDLQSHIEQQGRHLEHLPLVFQWNKRDLPNVISVEELSMRLNRWNGPHFEARALEGVGVFECLKAVSQRILINLKKNFP